MGIPVIPDFWQGITVWFPAKQLLWKQKLRKLMEISIAGLINRLKSSRASHSGDWEGPDWGPEGEKFSALSSRGPTAPPVPKKTIAGHPFREILGQVWFCPRILQLESVSVVLLDHKIEYFLLFPLFLIHGEILRVSWQEEPLPGMLAGHNSQFLKDGMENQP